MSEQFLGEIRRFPYSQIPDGWTLCNGQLLPINQNQALFALLGTAYGGDGMRSFALPNLQGRTAVGVDPGIGSIGLAGGGTGESQAYLTLVFAIAVKGVFPTS